MDGALLQAKVDRGYGKAAAVIGLDFAVYRPDTVLNPIGLGTYLTTLKASFNAKDPTFKRPFTEKGFRVFGMFDGAQVQVGDYFVGDSGTYCLVEKDPILPYYLLACNNTVSVYRVSYVAGIATDTAIATNVPCCLVQKRARVPQDITGSLNIPMESARTSWEFSISLPVGTIRRLDKLVDAQGVEYVVDTPNHNGEFYVIDTSVYTADTNTVQRTIADLGQAITLRTLTEGAYDPATGSATSSYADTSRRAVVTDFTNQQYGQTLITDTRIVTGDVRCLMDASGVAPTLSSHVTVGGVEYAVMEVKSVNMSGATVIAYEMLLRR